MTLTELDRLVAWFGPEPTVKEWTARHVSKDRVCGWDLHREGNICSEVFNLTVRPSRFTTDPAASDVLERKIQETYGISYGGLSARWSCFMTPADGNGVGVDASHQSRLVALCLAAMRTRGITVVLE